MSDIEFQDEYMEALALSRERISDLTEAAHRTRQLMTNEITLFAGAVHQFTDLLQEARRVDQEGNTNSEESMRIRDRIYDLELKIINDHDKISDETESPPAKTLPLNFDSRYRFSASITYSQFIEDWFLGYFNGVPIYYIKDRCRGWIQSNGFSQYKKYRKVADLIVKLYGEQKVLKKAIQFEIIIRKIASSSVDDLAYTFKSVGKMASFLNGLDAVSKQKEWESETDRMDAIVNLFNKHKVLYVKKPKRIQKLLKKCTSEKKNRE